MARCFFSIDTNGSTSLDHCTRRSRLVFPCFGYFAQFDNQKLPFSSCENVDKSRGVDMALSVSAGYNLQCCFFSPCNCFCQLDTIAVTIRLTLPRTGLPIGYGPHRSLPPARSCASGPNSGHHYWDTRRVRYETASKLRKTFWKGPQGLTAPCC